MSKITKGSCLCGSVTYQFSGPELVFQYCHCSRCRKFTGSAYAANIIVNPEQFEWLSGESSVGRFEYPEARHFATCFCTRCGSSLPWLAKSGRSVIIPAGTLDEDPGIRPVHNIFYQDRAPWREAVEALVSYDALPTR
ncbi:MAG: GFA family protein [Gammaproteobacteria bacterium]